MAHPTSTSFLKSPAGATALLSRLQTKTPFYWRGQQVRQQSSFLYSKGFIFEHGAPRRQLKSKQYSNQRAMPIPDYQTIMLPLLRLLADAKQHALRDLVDILGRQFSLTEEELNEMLSSGQGTH